MNDSRLAISVTHADGDVTRWGFDEVDGGTVPTDLSFSTAMPGGFKDASCSLLREIDPRADEALFDDLRIYGPGNQTAWEGRLAQFPRQGGKTASVVPGAVGYSAHLEDYKGFRMPYVDRDRGSFTDPSLARRADFLTSGGSFGGGNIDTSQGIAFTVDPGQSVSAGGRLNLETWYKAPPGVQIARIEYAATTTGSFTGYSALSTNAFYTANSDGAGTTYSNYGIIADGAVHGQSIGPGRFVAFIVGTAGGAAMTTPSNTSLIYQQVALYGNHSVPLRLIAGGTSGVYASDVIADIVDRAAPLLNVTSTSVQGTTFAIPHLVFATPTTAADAIAQTNAYHSWDWAVWEDRTFYYGPPSQGVEWQARIADGAQLSLEGDTAEQIISGVIVSYTDNGVQKLAGPVGSGCDVESSSLEDQSADNPWNAHYPTANRWPVLSISFPTTAAGAVELGAIYLAETNLASRKGSITLQGTVRHPTEGEVPVWRVRAGDSVVITDKAGDVSRRIVGTSYTHGSRQITLDCGIGSNKLEALLERLSVVTGLLS